LLKAFIDSQKREREVVVATLNKVLFLTFWYC